MEAVVIISQEALQKAITFNVIKKNIQDGATTGKCIIFTI